VEIYVTGPRKYIDERDTPSTLAAHRCIYSTTNSPLIEELVAILGSRDNKERVADINALRGYTYHLLLFQDENKSVMHFRVFETTEVKTSWCMVDPRSDTGAVYFSARIGPWLHSHLAPATSGPVPRSDTNVSVTQEPSHEERRN
jgi:hypothetical protein